MSLKQTLCAFTEEKCVVLVIRTVLSIYCKYYAVTLYPIFVSSLLLFCFPLLDALYNTVNLNALLFSFYEK